MLIQPVDNSIDGNLMITNLAVLFATFFFSKNPQCHCTSVDEVFFHAVCVSDRNKVIFLTSQKQNILFYSFTQSIHPMF